ncbi:MAG: carbonic anhydrase family protein [Alphaproteobacteria bacterium]
MPRFQKDEERPEMKKTVLTAALLLSMAIPAWAEDAGHAVPSEEVLHKHWDYAGPETGASHWGELEAAFEACKTGELQSPINIESFYQGELPALETAYSAVPLHVINNGHTIQVDLGDNAGTLNVAGKTYKLLQVHFHTPSEHYIDGSPYPMEAHLVHKAEDGTLAVVGVLMKVGAHNPVIEGIWQNAPVAGGEKMLETVSVSAADLLPESLEYYKYDGSLTTPPCSEGVQWHVLKDPIELSQAQLTAFQTVFPVNARPIQDLNGRTVRGN